MDAEIITTGTEILLGEIVDTNATWLARRLRDLGINLYYKTTIGDNQARIAAAMRQALARSDLVLVTGGLGPTVDDVTREAAAEATDRRLALHEACFADIQALFARWGRGVQENNRRQAFLPVGAIPVTNPVGTAPGFIVSVNREQRPAALLICLPGVPREMKHLMQETVEPFLATRLGADRLVIRARVLRCVGMGESAIDDRIGDLMRASNPTVGLAAHLGQVDVRVTARASSSQEADRLIGEVVAELRTRLGRVIYGEGEESLESVVAAQLQGAGHSLALLETNTGGQVAQRLRSAAGGDQVLRASLVIAADVPADLEILPSEVQRDSQAAADGSARWLLEKPEVRCGASLVLALCGTMDPAAGPYGSYRGQTFMTLASDTGLWRHRVEVGGVDELAQRWAGNAALNWLRLWLERA